MAPEQLALRQVAVDSALPRLRTHFLSVSCALRSVPRRPVLNGPTLLINRQQDLRTTSEY